MNEEYGAYAHEFIDAYNGFYDDNMKVNTAVPYMVPAMPPHMPRPFMRMPAVYPPCITYRMSIPSIYHIPASAEPNIDGSMLDMEMPNMDMVSYEEAVQKCSNCSMHDENLCDENYYKEAYEEECEKPKKCPDYSYPKLSKETKELLKELMALDFTLLDLGLYLDTHPMDKKALKKFKCYMEKRDVLLKKVEEAYGPITFYHGANEMWEWTKQPWPWRIDF